MSRQNPKFYMELYCIIHQQSLCEKTLKSELIMEVVVLVVNFIQSHGLNHRHFQYLLLETDAEYEDVLYHTEV
jgi:hypothetical protein